MAQLSPAEARARMSKLLSRCVYLALGLKECLEDEHTALKTEDSEALRDAATNKGKCVDQLQALEQERSSLCAELGFESGTQQMQHLADWCDEDETIAGRWQHLIEIASDCSARNLTNGAIIRMRQQQIEAGLAIIRGGSPIPESYGPGGLNRTATSPRAISEA